MPFARPTLSQLRNQARQDINANLPGADATLRFSNLGVLGDILAGMAHQLYGYDDWIARQAVPYTATDEYLEAWAALKNVTRKPATVASGVISFPGTDGTVIEEGTSVLRSDGVAYVSTAEATVTGGVVLVPVSAVPDPAGLTGANGNSPAGTQFTLGAPVAGVTSTGSATTALVGGADIETNDSLRSRMLFAYQNPPQGGAESDYIRWASDVPGVTRVWVNPIGVGAGTVVVYVMFDDANASTGGFPVGTDGGATNEKRIDPATGDQLTVANHIYPLRPVTAVVHVCAPLAAPIDFTISGSALFTDTIKAQVANAITEVFLLYGSPLGSTIDISYIEDAIAEIPGTAGFVIDLPDGNIPTQLGYLPVLGTITWSD